MSDLIDITSSGIGWFFIIIGIIRLFLHENNRDTEYGILYGMIFGALMIIAGNL